MKSYCVQNNGDCGTCSLVNYGKDCMNEPVHQMTRQEARQRIEDAAHDIGPGCHDAWAGSCRQDKEEAVNRVVDGADPEEVAGEFLR